VYYNNQQPTTNNQQPTTNNQQPTTNNHHTNTPTHQHTNTPTQQHNNTTTQQHNNTTTQRCLVMFKTRSECIVEMSDFLANDWWRESSVFASLALPFGVSAKNSCASDSTWEHLDGNNETFLALEKLLTGQRASYWQHERLDWGEHVQKLLHENRFHIRYHMPLEDFDTLVKIFGDEVVRTSGKCSNYLLG
jgi:hypothetical protein